MTYKVEILPTAWEDLKRIEDWYLVQFGVETALKVSNHILDTIERLERFPDSGSLIPCLLYTSHGILRTINIGLSSRHPLHLFLFALPVV